MRGAIDRSRPPSDGVPEGFDFPPFDHAELAPGVDCYAASVDRGPLVAVELVMPGGGEHDPAGADGLAAFSAALLDDGCERLAAPDIAAAVERLGGSLSASSDWDAAYLSISVLAHHLDTAIALIAELAATASFPEAEIERLRRQRLTELLRRTTQPSALAADRLARAIYVEGPYASPLLGRREAIEAIEREAVVDFASRRLQVGGCTLVASGDLDVERLRELGAEALSDWPSTPPARRPGIAPAPLPGVVVEIVDRPGASQTELRVGHSGPPRDHPDRVPLRVMNAILGGKFTSRINLNLRERHGFTYGAHSYVPGRRGRGPFQVAAAVATESAGAATGEIFAELARIRDEPVSDDELTDATRYLEGVFPYTVQSGDEIADRLATLAVYELPDDYYQRYFEELRAVDTGAIQRVAREHLDPEHAVVVAVGPAAELEPQLASFGPVTVTTPD